MTTSSGPAPWERQPTDTPKQWEAFRAYRDLGPRRTLIRVAQELGKSGALLSRWNTAGGWVERAAAWDAEQDRMYRDQVKREAYLRARVHGDTARAMLAKGLQALKTLDAARLDPTEIRQFIAEALKIERALYGLDATEDEQVRGSITVIMDAGVMTGPTLRPGDLAGSGADGDTLDH